MVFIFPELHKERAPLKQCFVDPFFFFQDACWVAVIVWPFSSVFWGADPAFSVKLDGLHAHFWTQSWSCSFPLVQTCLFCCSMLMFYLTSAMSYRYPIASWYGGISDTPVLFCCGIHYCLCVNFLWKTSFWNASNKWANMMGTFSTQKKSKSPSFMNAQNDPSLVMLLWPQSSWQPFLSPLLSTGSLAISALGQGPCALLVSVKYCPMLGRGDWCCWLEPCTPPCPWALSGLQRVINLCASNPLV